MDTPIKTYRQMKFSAKLHPTVYYHQIQITI
jgi:hypothetical protein